MKAGDIIFIRSNSITSKIIRIIDGGPYSHVAVAVSNTHILESLYFTKVRITEMEYKHFEVIDLGLTKEQRDQIVHMGIELVGRWYDYLQVLWYFIDAFIKLNSKKIWNSKNNLICSELVYILLHGVGYLPEDTYFGNITPHELYYLLKGMVKSSAG